MEPIKMKRGGVTLQVDEDRLELSAYDYLQLGGLVLMATSGVPVTVVLYALIGEAAFIALVAIVFLAAMTAELRVVVTQEGAVAEWRTLGIPHRRIDLGRHPELEYGLVWSWSEVAVSPQPEYRSAKLHDGDRVVLKNYYHDDDSRYAELVARARQAIDRLHGPAEADGTVW